MGLAPLKARYDRALKRTRERWLGATRPANAHRLKVARPEAAGSVTKLSQSR